MAQDLPQHLRKYVVEQNYEKYTPVDQACWRYILRQLRAFLGTHAHECYLEGLEKTGIDVERIPRIEEISKKIEKFGWRALPVSGFIPPAAFMELQALSVLPIASDMRTVDHLMYTPAPDIVHEAAGHAPILVHPEFAEYLKKYSQVARKAIISKDDLDLYEAIRDLSDIKENPASTPAEIKAAEKHLETVSKSITKISEASELSRMNWWTAEYGLIGSLDKPKIFGAGLLSSVGESKWCLSDKVKKIPLSVECIKQGYDITEPQPQLFVAPDFQTLHRVLEEMADQMAFRKGGLSSVKKAIEARSVNTVELDSGIQISGICIEASTDQNGKAAFLKWTGPTQLAYSDKELPDQGCQWHAQGFSTPIGRPEGTDKPLSQLTEQELSALQWTPGQPIDLKYPSGLHVQGVIKSWTRKENRNLILSLEKAKATWNDEVLFAPDWGVYDIALGETIPSVFGGPADRIAFGETDDFVAKKVPTPQYSEKQQNLFTAYQRVRNLREQKASGTALSDALSTVLQDTIKNYPNEWLLVLEIYELLKNRGSSSAAETITTEALNYLQQLLSSAKTPEHVKTSIQDGLLLAGNI